MKIDSMGWDKERLTALTLKYIKGELTVAEEAELQQWLNAHPINRQRFEARVSEEKISEGLVVWQAAKESKARAMERVVQGRSSAIWRRVAIAAAVLIILLAGGVALLWGGKVKPVSPSVAKEAKDIPPGGNKAILTLANGTSIVLDSSSKGLIAKQGREMIVKTDSGQLTYEEGKGDAEIGLNTISTPRGAEWEVRLPDGTKAWLNAGSSIRFPTAFSGSRREVEMTGEIYFEVAHKAEHPFVVEVNGREIEDIGTHFDVNAYEDEPQMKTTLLEGSVKVAGTVLQPGQQLQIDKNGKSELLRNANMEESIAWKDGLFEFNSADIATVMRAIARWYNVTVNYQRGKNSQRFTGQIPRSVTASEALQILETSGYHFKIEENTVTVLP